MPVAPAAQYRCGGIRTDAWGRAAVRQLWAIGEVACTGLPGANRLASNSLLEVLVFAHRAYEQLKSESLGAGRENGAGPGIRASDLGSIQVPPWNPGNARNSDEQVVITQNWDEVRQLMWNYVGIARSDRRLERAYRRIQLLQQEIQEYYWDFIVTSDLIELRNLATVAELVVRCAMMRKESRGLHYNSDHPDRDDVHFRQDTLVAKPTLSAPAPTLHTL